MATVLENLVTALRNTATYNANAQAAPTVILWTDKEQQWSTVLPQLRSALPELLTLGEFNLATSTGPAIWLKCVVAGEIKDVVPEDRLPIIYLPGISKADLRDVEHCDTAVKPLAELQYRGVVWSQVNGKDWTVNAYLTAGAEGLGLDVAKDRVTQDAMNTALEVLLTTPVVELEDKHLEASDFNQLMSPDPIRDLLTWMNSPGDAKVLWASGRWQALNHFAQADFGLDIEKDGDYVAAEKLCAREGKWHQVWDRFCESPGSYPLLPALLERIPLPDLLAEPDQYPAANTKEEEALRLQLGELKNRSADEARAGILKLEERHGARRENIWAQLGQSSWAILLAPLVEVATGTQSSIGGLTPQEMGDKFQAQGWQVDRAMIEAFKRCASGEQTMLVEDLLAIIYSSWLAELNQQFQQLVQSKGYPGGDIAEATAVYQTQGEVVFFVDGLRLDTAHLLVEQLAIKKIETQLSTQWSALPSVTATAKAAVSPVYQHLIGEADGNDFEPSIKGQGTLSTDRFRQLLEREGWQYLNETELGDAGGKAWIACGDIDKEGHSSELKLPKRLPGILDGITERIVELLAHGWQKIRIVTDHGWLLVPGKMPKTDLPMQAVESRWGRCAQLKQGVQVDGLTLGWHWNANTPIHYPHGIHSFIAGRAYGHGGVSLQECLVPVLTIRNSIETIVSAKIVEVRWRGLICRVEVASEAKALQVDLRTKVADSATSVVQMKHVEDGSVSLMVLDDDNEGLSAVVVVVDENGHILAKQNTAVGGDD